MKIKMIKVDKDALVKEAAIIWDQVVEEGKAFPQINKLNDVESAKEFFNAQSYVGAAINEENNEMVGMYILHPNNVGRCGHICNASYAVRRDLRGNHIGEYLVKDCMKKAKEIGFRVLQFNAVVASNEVALKLYKKLGFTPLGRIPNGFLNINNEYEDIIPHYIELK